MTTVTSPLAFSILNSQNMESVAGVSSRDVSYIKNGYILKDPLDQLYVQKREGYTRSLTTSANIQSVFKDPEGDVCTIQDDGANINFFEGTNNRGTVNNLLSSTTSRVSWASDDTYIMIASSGSRGATTDGYVLNKVTSALAAITDADFPLNASTTVQLANGIVNIDGFFFVGTFKDSNKVFDGRIYNSALGDPLNWNSLDFIGAGLEGDGVVAISKHHNNLVSFGTRTIEFFYNAGNPSGSPLARRNDVSYQVGALPPDIGGTTISNIVNYKDTLYFLASSYEDPSVIDKIAPSLYKIENFQLKKISNPAIDFIFRTVLSAPRLIGCLTNQGGAYLIIQGLASNQVLSYVYDLTHEVWYIWTLGKIKTIHSNLFNKLSDTGALTQGVYKFGDTNSSGLITYQDTIDNSASPTNYEFSVVTPKINEIKELNTFSGSTIGKRKFCNQLKINTDRASSTLNLDISYTDDDYIAFSTPRTLDISNPRNSLTRNGQFTERAYKISYTGSNPVRLKDLVLDITIST